MTPAVLSTFHSVLFLCISIL